MNWLLSAVVALTLLSGAFQLGRWVENRSWEKLMTRAAQDLEVEQRFEKHEEWLNESIRLGRSAEEWYAGRPAS